MGDSQTGEHLHHGRSPPTGVKVLSPTSGFPLCPHYYLHLGGSVPRGQTPAAQPGPHLSPASRPHQIRLSFPFCVYIGSFSFDFRLQVSVRCSDWMGTKGLHPHFSTCSDIMVFHLAECSCLYINNYIHYDINNFHSGPVYRVKIPSLGKSAGPQQS